MTPPPLVITAGEPAGIGPDLCILLAQQPPAVPWAVIADPDLLSARAASLGLPLILQIVEPDDTLPACPQQPGCMPVIPVTLAHAARPGHLEPDNAHYVLTCLDLAIEGCQSGRYAALVTGPVHKGVINDAGIAFSGHTEYLAAKTATPQVVMMLATAGLRVALVTTHLPVREVPDAITAETLAGVLRILHQELQSRFGIDAQRILVCGLNPHAGESGHLGREEITVIAPVLERLREAGMELLGHLPADTLFNEKYLSTADAVLAMYHDQGLPVLKYKGFGRAVNITLGLPFIRTSVDHGTALDLAGSGNIDPGSLRLAMEQAAQMARMDRP